MSLIRVLSRIGLTGTVSSAARPALYAATSPDAGGGRFYGPRGLGHLSGPPAEQPVYSRLVSVDDGARIWSISEELTHVSLPGLPGGHQTSPSRQSHTS